LTVPGGRIEPGSRRIALPTVRMANANREGMNYWFTNDFDAIGWRPTFTQEGQT
jgi:hypothetical protein